MRATDPLTSAHHCLFSYRAILLIPAKLAISGALANSHNNYELFEINEIAFYCRPRDSIHQSRALVKYWNSPPLYLQAPSHHGWIENECKC